MRSFFLVHDIHLMIRVWLVVAGLVLGFSHPQLYREAWYKAELVGITIEHIT